MLKAYGKLIYFDLYLASGNFSALYEKVRNCPVRNEARDPRSIEDICYAVDMAGIWYWKEALACRDRLQRRAC